jgi:peptidoglycan/xylan/chitin deacetylase (PgdA/CDA1 family)
LNTIPSRRRTGFVAYILTLFLLSVVLGTVGCGHPNRLTAHTKPIHAKPGTQVISVTTLPEPLAKVRPDELGRIPIVMYHAIGGAADRQARDPSRYDRHGMNISTATFRKQLTLMAAAGWYPVNVRDLLTTHLDVPLGKTPVALTFDDSRPSQFRIRPDGTVDPDCAVGILEAFHTTHPDWPLRGTFYVLPHSSWNPAPFGQVTRTGEKLRRLVSLGFEVANHSTTHRLMSHLDAHTLRWELAGCVRYVHALAPGATMDTLALPGGAAPHGQAAWDSLRSGTDGGTAYHNNCILGAWGGPTFAWADRRFDADRMRRIGVSPGYLEHWIRRLSLGHPAPQYVSDGDPGTITVPRAEAAFVDHTRLSGVRLVIYGPAAAPKLPASSDRPRSGDASGRQNFPTARLGKHL